MATDNDQNPMTQTEGEESAKRTESFKTEPLTPQDYLGIILKDRYLIDKIIGSGGIGIVYLARDRKLMNRPVVIKVIHQNLLGTELGDWFRKKFTQEIEALSRIDHPGVVGVFDTGEMPDGRSYLVMQYVDGITLRSAIPDQGMDLKKAGRLLKQIGSALNAAHEKGVLHRDLKPENIMLQDLGNGELQVKLIDFGIAQVADSHEEARTQITKISGSPPYMAPEQLRGRPSKPSDTYAIGVVAYEMITGSRPFDAETVVSMYEEQRTGVRVKPREIRPMLPIEAERSILKALSFDKNDRHATVRDFTDELSGILLGESPGFIEPETEVIEYDDPANQVTTQQSTARQTIAEPETVANPAQTKSGLPARLPVIGSMIVLALIAALIFFRTTSTPDPAPEPDPEAVVAPALPQRSISYWAVVQKYRDGQPYQQPFKLPGDILFEKDYRVRLHFLSEMQGYLYLINEGPEPVNDQPAYVVLFPKPTVNDGSAEILPDHDLSTPEFSFDDEQGTEKLWLVWAAKAVPELEAVKGVVNVRELGAITKPDQIKSVTEYLNKHYSGDKLTVIKDDKSKQMSVKGSGEVLVHLLKLEHH